MATAQELAKLREKSKKSPRNGKRGPSKATLALNAALEKQADNIVKDLLIGRSRLINEMTKKKLSAAKLRDLVDGIDKFTKNIQLLSGKETGREGVIFKWKNYEPRNTKKS